MYVQRLRTSKLDRTQNLQIVAIIMVGTRLLYNHLSPRDTQETLDAT